MTIADLKTSARRYTENQVDNHLQSALYAYALRRLDYTTDGQNVLIRFDVLLKTKTPDMESYHAVKAEEDEAWTLALIRRALRAIEAGAYYPVRSWRYAECPFRRRCAADIA